VNPLKVCPQCGTEYPANARFCEIDGTALRSAGGDTDMVGSIVADRYHILKKLGEGGMGQVYLAEHVKMGRKSALKVMHPGMVKDVDAISRFNREAANASRISHPNVAAVYDFGETPDGVIFLAMEFVDGPPLTKIIEQSGALPATRAAEIVRQTAEALAQAHDMGIVHRDLKPDNIMVAKTRDGADLVKVVDFGIAKAAGNDAQKVTKTGLVVGTPEYMSPEQLAGDKLDGRSDIYSLGLVAFNMLTGKLPFPSDSAQESMIMRLTDKPKALSEMRPEVSWPADVQRVMDKALERDVTQRYQTATEFGRELHRAIERMPEAVAAELGTQMIQVPPTRVGGSPETPRTSVSSPPPVAAPAAATVAVPTPAPAGPAVTGAAAPPRRKMLIPLVGGIVAVGLAAAVFVPKVVGGNPGKSADTSRAITQTPTQAGNAGTDSGSANPNAPSSSSHAAAPSQSASTKPANDDPTLVAKGQPKSVLEQLRGMIDLANDSTKGRTVLAAVAKLDVRSSEEIYFAALLRSKVYEHRGEPDRACSELRNVLSKLAQSEADQAKDRMDNALGCP